MPEDLQVTLPNHIFERDRLSAACPTPTLAGCNRSRSPTSSAPLSCPRLRRQHGRFVRPAASGHLSAADAHRPGNAAARQLRPQAPLLAHTTSGQASVRRDRGRKR
jgi:hypothetical protein